MAIDASIYQQLRPVEVPSMMDSQQKAATLGNLAMQNQHMGQQMQSAKRQEDYNSHLQKASQFGQELEGLAGMSPQERAAAWPGVKDQLVQQGVIKPMDAPSDHDEGYFRQSLMKYRQSKEGIERELDKAKILNLKAEAAKNFASSNEGKTPSQSQFAAATYGTRANQAEGVFTDLAKKGYDPTTSGQALARNVPNFMEGLKTENSKRQDQAERNFVNAIMRRESGAAISKDEFSSAEKQYFPRNGDSPEVLRQKELNRKTVGASLIAEGAPAMSRIGSQMSGIELGTSIPKKQTSQELIPSAVADERAPRAATPKIKHGTEMDGFVFMGGNPAEQKNWKKAR